MSKRLRIMTTKAAMAIAALFLATAPAFAQAENSLDKCEKAAAKQGASFVKARSKAIQKCLQKISGELIESNAPNVARAAMGCVASFRKLVNTEVPNKTLAAKAKAKMRKACDPTVSTGLGHTANQVLSLTPAIVAEGIEAKTIEGYCFSFGGDSNFDNVEEWADCQVGGGTCEVNQSISVQYPRALEWLAAVKAQIQLDPKYIGGDPKFVDAVTAIDQVRLALDSSGADANLDINCGPGNGLCGNGVIDANEECDGTNLNTQTCTTLGFPEGGTLSCQGNCGFNYQGCISGTFSQTGQTLSFDSGDDGAVQAGPTFSYLDNADGTITDQNSGLIWEKLSDDGSVHDQNNGYTWSDGFTIKIAALNTVPCFTGHCDWRMPNRHEITSMLDLGAFGPATHSIFNSGCALNCTVLTCSCTPSTLHWTSTTREAGGGTNAWYVALQDGFTSFSSKSSTLAVRAVRGP